VVGEWDVGWYPAWEDVGLGCIHLFRCNLGIHMMAYRFSAWSPVSFPPSGAVASFLMVILQFCLDFHHVMKSSNLPYCLCHTTSSYHPVFAKPR
jgi:hypothetical protein